MKARFIAVIFLLASASVQAGVVKGKIKAARTGEEIIDAPVMAKQEPGKRTVTGLVGSFNLSVNRNKYTLVCSYIGYTTYEATVES